MRGEGIVIAGCARDCAPHLPAVLANIDALARRFARVAYLFVENDSRDETRRVLADFGRERTRFRCMSLDGLDEVAPQRTVRLALIRNAIVECFRVQHELHDCRYLAMVDMDDANARPWDLDVVDRSLAWMDARADTAGIFANQIGVYYDLWALRHPERCPLDAWEEVLDYQTLRDCSDTAAFNATFARRIFRIPLDAAPLEVQSAFGGLGFYRTEFLRRNTIQYLGSKVKVVRRGADFTIARWQQCEHVEFHRGLVQAGGRLFVMPQLVNRDCSGARFNAAAHHRLLF